MIDLRSDTVTKPTPEMREVIAKAEVGDDVYRDDPTVILLEEKSAEILGKEAGLFMPSGTMGNLAAIITHCERGSEIILGDKAHTFLFEVGGIAALGGIQTHIVPNQKDGTLDLEDIKNAIRSDDIHDPPTRLITIENTHNRCGGVALSDEYTREVGRIAQEHRVKLHLDGARIFNAAAALDLPPAALVEPADSVMFCLSKGLGAPVGSILCGSAPFIQKARKIRKMLGGGMRQAGVIAAAGIYALDHNLLLLNDDHDRAKKIALGLSKIDGINLMDENPPTNMVYVQFPDELPISPDQVAEKLKENNIMVGRESERQFRLVTHLWITDEDVEVIVETFNKILS
jgi:threonine aldolase